jgi:DNA-directed RNA polymerase specialized sigma24 family protein
MRGRRPFDAVRTMTRIDDDRDERTLLARVRDGDELAFVRLLNHHRRGLGLYCLLMLGDPDAADDVIVETALTAWRERNLLHVQMTARMWLYRIAARRCFEALGEPATSFGADDPLDAVKSNEGPDHARRS